MLHRLRLGWWNTNLSPTKGGANCSDEECLEAMVRVLRLMLTKYSCDLIGLCEVNEHDIAYINNELSLSDIGLIDLVSAAGRSRFDMAIAFNNKKVAIKKEREFKETVTGNTLKVAQVVNVGNVFDDSSFRLYLCHWASKLYGDGMARRDEAAKYLYADCKTLMNDGGSVIVMGDFNAEPYENCLVNEMRANRCHEAVKKYPREFFYNPFWRTIVSEKRFGYLMNNEEFRSGSYRYKEFKNTIWHSLDQIILSGSFLNGNDWQLNEFFTNVLYDESFYEEGKKMNIDHFPVICEIVKV